MNHPRNGKRLSAFAIDEAFVAIVCLPINGAFPPLDFDTLTTPKDMIRPLQQVTIRKDKLSAMGLIRFGDTNGDEALCWIHPHNVLVVEVLGRAIQQEKFDGARQPIGWEWICAPFTEEQIAKAA